MLLGAPDDRCDSQFGFDVGIADALALARLNVTDVVGNSGSDGNALLTPLIRIGAIFAGRKEGGIL